MASPLVSVIVPTYNRAALIGKCITSIKSQTYRNIEIVVVDDGSTDDTIDVITREHPDVKLHAQKNAGPSAARNRGVVLSQGDFIAFQDSDDLWHPTKIDRQIALLTRLGRRVSCCVCNTLINTGTGQDGSGPTSSFAAANLVRSCPREGVLLNADEVISDRFVLFNQAVAMTRDAFEKTNGYPEDLRLLEDYYLAFSLALQGPWAVIREELVEKDNDTQGIGVQAMNDKRKHLRARIAVLDKIVGNVQGIPSGVRLRLMRKLKGAKRNLTELEKGQTGALATIFSSARTTNRRLINAISRRFLGPRPKFEEIC